MKKLKRGTNSGLVYFSIADIRSWNPCYDPSKYLTDPWRGTAKSILLDARIPASDRLWVVLRTSIVSERVMRLFAVWSARQVQHLMNDPRSVKALDVTEAFANGLATEEERKAAAYAAADAAYAAAARQKAKEAQLTKLIEMINAEGKEYIAKKRGKK